MGAKSKLKSGLAGDKKGKPPAALVRSAPGRGPSQTPPSLATDSSISPVPLSLAAGTAHRELLPVALTANRGFSPGMQGAGALHENNLGSPFPPGRVEG